MKRARHLNDEALERLRYTIIRRTIVQSTCGLSRSSLYTHVKLGTFTRSVRIGKRSVGWPSREVEAINTARIAGVDDEGIRQLVVQLHADRVEKI